MNAGLRGVALAAILLGVQGAGLPAGFYARPDAANVVGVEALDPNAAPAADEIFRQLGASRTLRAVAIETGTDPAGSDCSTKPYAALAQLATTLIKTDAGWYYDLGLILVDCAGWSVDEWHESATSSMPPTATQAQWFGLNLLLRLRTWAYMEPSLARELFERGLAYDPSTGKSSYFYTLFKTDDGYMRALVRPGGPAYIAGMRSDDVVDKVDGKFWWEYGTYQTQQRPYDGKPHTFEITRGKTTVNVALGAPFVP